jgi:hypothetical protein
VRPEPPLEPLPALPLGPPPAPAVRVQVRRPVARRVLLVPALRVAPRRALEPAVLVAVVLVQALRVAPRRALVVPALRVAPRRALEPAVLAAAVRELAVVLVQAL